MLDLYPETSRFVEFYSTSIPTHGLDCWVKVTNCMITLSLQYQDPDQILVLQVTDSVCTSVSSKEFTLMMLSFGSFNAVMKPA